MLSRRNFLLGFAAIPVVAPAIISDAMKPTFAAGGTVWQIPQDWNSAVIQVFPPCENLALRPWAEQAQEAVDKMLLEVGPLPPEVKITVGSRPPEPIREEVEECRQFVIPGNEEARDVVMTTRKLECERDLTSEEIQIGRENSNARASDASTG